MELKKWEKLYCENCRAYFLVEESVNCEDYFCPYCGETKDVVILNKIFLF
jgi:Zn finger protein HypA/HybF involved in hydrogenase expression